MPLLQMVNCKMSLHRSICTSKNENVLFFYMQKDSLFKARTSIKFICIYLFFVGGDVCCCFLFVCCCCYVCGCWVVVFPGEGGNFDIIHKTDLIKNVQKLNETPKFGCNSPNDSQRGLPWPLGHTGYCANIQYSTGVNLNYIDQIKLEFSFYQYNMPYGPHSFICHLISLYTQYTTPVK